MASASRKPASAASNARALSLDAVDIRSCMIEPCIDEAPKIDMIRRITSDIISATPLWVLIEMFITTSLA
jgi:hypothetical protein